MSANICSGDILAIQTGIIVHGCSISGIFDTAIANKWPQVYESYSANMTKLKTGDVSIIWLDDSMTFAIANAVTLSDNVNDIDNESFRTIFEKVLQSAKIDNLSIHYHQSISGQDQSNFNQVYKTICSVLNDHQHYLWLSQEDKNLQF